MTVDRRLLLMNEAEARLRELLDVSPAAEQTLKPGGGGGSYSDMEARVAKLEADMGNVKTDVADIKADLRKILGALIGGFLVLGGAYATGYLKLSDKLGSLELSAERQNGKLDLIVDRLPKRD